MVICRLWLLALLLALCAAQPPAPEMFADSCNKDKVCNAIKPSEGKIDASFKKGDSFGFQWRSRWTDKDEWKLRIKYKNGDTESIERCKIELGFMRKFNCDLSTREELKPNVWIEGKTLKELDYNVITIKKEDPSNQDSMADVLEFYKRPYITIDGFVNGEYITAKTESIRRTHSAKDDQFISTCYDKVDPVLPGSGAIEAQEDTEQFIFECTQEDRKEMYFDKTPVAFPFSGISELYCSDAGWRTRDGEKLGGARRKPVCWGPPLFVGCEQKDIHCYSYDVSKAKDKFQYEAATPTAATAPKEGFRLDARNNKEWLMTYNFASFNQEKCKFYFSEKKFTTDKETISCDPGDVKQGVNGVTSIKITKDAKNILLVPYYSLYKQEEQFLQVTGKDNSEKPLSIRADAIKLYEACNTVTTMSTVSAIATYTAMQKDGAKRFCSKGHRYHTLYIGANAAQKDDEPVDAVYCSAQGWCTDDGTVVAKKEEGKKEEAPYCWDEIKESFPMFENCEEETKLCIKFNDATAPTALVRAITSPVDNKVGIYIDTANEKEWHVTLAWPMGHSECKVDLGFLPEFDCDGNPNSNDNKVKIVRDKQGRDTTEKTEQVKLIITSVNDEDPVLDALLLYDSTKKMNFAMRLGQNAAPIAIADANFEFKCKQKDPASALPSTYAELATGNNNKFACTGPLNNLIFIGSTKAVGDQKVVWCSQRGWRKDNHEFIAENKEDTIFCSTETTIGVVDIFNKCDQKDHECHVIDTTNTGKLKKITTEKHETAVGFDLDMSDDKKWTLKMAHHPKEKCTFSIGKAKFECNGQPQQVQEFGPEGKVKVTLMTVGRTVKDYELNIEEYIIESKDPVEPVLDTLRLYTTLAEAVKITDRNSPLTSEKISFFTECTDGNFPQPAAWHSDASKAKKDKNKYSCEAEKYKEIFLNDVNTKKSGTVFCSKRGWRDSNHVFFGDFNKDTVYCYSEYPSRPLPLFTACEDDRKMCFTYDGTGTKLELKRALSKPEEGALGVEIDMTNSDEWAVTMVWDKTISSCKFAIGGELLKFDCKKKVGDNQDGKTVTVKKDNEGPEKSLIYEKYIIKSKTAEEPVSDALLMYKNPSHVVTVEISGKTHPSSAVTFFKDCVLSEPDMRISTKAQKATPDGTEKGKFNCENKLLPEIYVNNEAGDQSYAQGTGTLVCSVRGWRDGAGTFKTALTNKQPFCYTKEQPSIIPMFKQTTDADGCDNFECYAFENILGKTPNTASLNLKKIQAEFAEYIPPLGFELDHRDDTKWTLIVAYENEEDLSLQIGDSKIVTIQGKKKGDIDDQTIPEVKIVFEEVGRDGTVFMYKLVITPADSNSEKSLIDSLKLYDDAEYLIKLHFKGSKTFTTKTGIAFFPKCPIGPTTLTTTHNKYTCPDPLSTILLNDESIDLNEASCSKLGWRSKGKKLSKFGVKGFDNFAPRCENLCDAKFMVISDAHGKDNVAVNPVFDGNKWTCKDASIKIAGEFYNEVKCANNKWTGDGASIKVDEKYKFTAECFGSFLFLKDNCNTDAQKDEGCVEPTLTGNVITCGAGYALTYLDKMYDSLKVIKGEWEDSTGKKWKAGDTQIIGCYSKCRKENIKKTAPSKSVEAYGQNAVYTWDKANNEGKLSCKGTTEILIADFVSKDQGYFTSTDNNWVCKPDGWTAPGGGSLTKPMKTITDVPKLKVHAYCVEACSSRKIGDDCNGDAECKKPKFESGELACDDGYVMSFDGKEYTKTLECTALGWTEKGLTTPLLIDHKQKPKRDKEIKVACFDKCSNKYRKNDGASPKPTYSDNVMACAGTDMISYKKKTTPEFTLDDLKCVNTVGWKAESAPHSLLIDFAADGHVFKADCTPSCLPKLIDAPCTADATCSPAKMNSDIIKCDDTHMLQHDATFTDSKITCDKKSFVSEDNTISVQRVNHETTIKAECYSKCHEKFVTKTPVPGVPQPQETVPAPNTRTIECPDKLQYTKLTANSIDFYTAKPLTCDPAKGWTAVDIPTGLIVDFKNAKVFVEASCFDFCKERINTAFCPPEIPAAECVKKPDYASGKISCGPEHTLNANGKDMLRETLECTPLGYVRKSDPTTNVFPLNNMNPEVKFDMYCFSNCAERLVTGLKAQNDQLSCKPDELLVVDTTASQRVFGDSKCTPATGWSGPIANAANDDTEDKMVVNFDTVVRFAASCVKVCTADNLDATGGTGDLSPSQFAAQKLSCLPNYRLFLKHDAMAETETGPVECSRLGWRKESETDPKKRVINFLDANVKIAERVTTTCKHKCHPDFIDPDSCPSADETAGKCTKVQYKNRKISCKGDTEIVVLEYRNPADPSKWERRESFTTAKCSDEGWKAGTETNVMFTPADDDFHVKAKCENVCDTLTETDKESRGWIEDEETKTRMLTCKNDDEKLIFNGNDWYTDMTCSKEGWKAFNLTTHPEAIVAFAANKPIAPLGTADTPRLMDAKCVKSQCVRDLTVPTGKTDPCQSFGTQTPTNRCPSRPNMWSRKYFMSCQKPMALIKLVVSTEKPLTYPGLYCKNDNWYTVNQLNQQTPTAVLMASAPFDLICQAGKCIKCKNSLKMIQCDGTDPNCDPIVYSDGAEFDCSKYMCKSDKYYKVMQNGAWKYFQPKDDSGNTRIHCSERQEIDPKKNILVARDIYFSPDGLYNIVEGADVGCVKWIPCNEHSPITTSCEGLSGDCDSTTLVAKLKVGSTYKNVAPVDVTCDAGKDLYRFVGDKMDWRKLKKLKCEKNGEWAVTVMAAPPNDPTGQEIETADKPLVANERVVCASSNPFVPESTTPPTTPRPGICTLCGKLPDQMTCDGCDYKFSTTPEDDTCKLKSSTGRFVIDGNEETTEELTCKETNGTFVWKDSRGHDVTQMASITRAIDAVNQGWIAAVVVGVFLLLASVAGFIVFIMIRKKREAQRQETLKSKGLEQKNDTIIDSMTIIEDVKTIRL